MTTPHPHDVRRQALLAFAELSTPVHDESAVMETVLVRDGAYYGRCFRHCDLIATWVAETGKLAVTREDGALLLTLEVDAAERLAHAA
jgi:hypothetical protein